MQPFDMYRKNDESHVSGTGKVLEGIVYSDGVTAVHWCSSLGPNSVGVYGSFNDFYAIHVDSHPTNQTEFSWYNIERQEPIKLEERIPWYDTVLR